MSFISSDDEIGRIGDQFGQNDGEPWRRLVKISIVMAVLNEERTIVRAVTEVLAGQYPCEIELIVVDDGSTDSTYERLSSVFDPRLRILRHWSNVGKGAAIFSGAAVATGTHLLPFDADMEYSPSDIPRLVDPIVRGRCDVVFGSRLVGANTVYQSFVYAMGNKFMTTAANLLYDAYVSDLHTCLKLIPIPLFRRLPLREKGFGLDTELTASMLRLGIRPFEVPISYFSRGRAEGKKITWRDGVACLQILGRVRFSRTMSRMRDHPAAPIGQT